MHDFTVKHLGTDFEVLTRNPTIGKIEFSALASGQSFNGFGIGLPPRPVMPTKPDRLITSERKYSGSKIDRLFDTIMESVAHDRNEWTVSETEHYINFSKYVDVNISVQVVRGISVLTGLAVPPTIKSFTVSYKNGSPVTIPADEVAIQTLDAISKKIRIIAEHVGRSLSGAEHAKFDHALDEAIKLV